MKTVILTKGYSALVDDSDFEFLSQWKWTAFYCSGILYAARRQRINGKQIVVFMHRVLGGASGGEQIDHKDGNGLNNQKSNLRISNQAQNMGNRRLNSNNTSGFKGVTALKLKSGRIRYVAKINSKDIGRFDSPILAAAAYDVVATERWGPFARTNAAMRLI